jgi:hypothetical protein
LADTLFVDATTTVAGTPLVAAWHNDANTDVYNTLSAVSGTNTIVATGPLSLTAYASGKWFKFVPANTNTGAVTINISTLGARSITKYGSTALVAGDLVVGMEAVLVDDGTRLQLINPRSVDLGTTVTGTLPIANGGTGATTVAGALANLGLVTQPTYRNRLINGDFNINQRAATSTTAGGTYIADRWSLSSSNANITHSLFSTANLTPNPTAGRLTATTGTAAGAANFWGLVQSIEGTLVADLRWGTASASTITVSFWLRSSITGTFGVAIRNSAINRSYVTSVTQNVAGTWEYKTVTIPGDQSGTWLTTAAAGIIVHITAGAGTNFLTTANTWTAGNFLGPTGMTNAMATNGNTFDVTGVQVESGSVATPYEFRPFTSEILLCQRYYFTSYIYGTAPGAASASNGSYRVVGNDPSNGLFMSSRWPVSMRGTPGVVIYQPLTGALSNLRNTQTGASVGLSTGIVADANGLYVATSAGGFAANALYECHVVATADI